MSRDLWCTILWSVHKPTVADLYCFRYIVFRHNFFQNFLAKDLSSHCYTVKTQSQTNLSSVSLKLDTQYSKDIINGIASGMYHLAKEQIVHRDLAARNVLVCV